MSDAELIKTLGGPTKLAARLKFDKEKGGVQRVQNWIKRGIPSKVKLEHPSLFLSKSATGPAPKSQPAKEGA